MGSLTGKQRAIIVGSLLGDGAMRCKANALLEVNHSLDQKAYVDWKFQQLADLVGTGPKERRGNGHRRAYRFTTLSLPQLTAYHRAFYETGKKSVPELELSSLSLAVWFMDDGCKSRTSVYLNTQQFDLGSQLRLVRLLQQLGVDSTLNRDKSYFRIRIAVRSMTRFKQMVDPHMLEELRYKLPA